MTGRRRLALPSSHSLGRALILTASATGLWLLGQAGASADEGAALPIGGAVVDVVAQTADPVLTSVAAVPAVVAEPVRVVVAEPVPVVVDTVAPAVEAVTRPVTGALRELPVVPAVPAPVVDVVDVVEDVVAVPEPVAPVVPPVDVDPAPVVEVPDADPAPAADRGSRGPAALDDAAPSPLERSAAAVPGAGAPGSAAARVDAEPTAPVVVPAPEVAPDGPGSDRFPVSAPASTPAPARPAPASAAGGGAPGGAPGGAGDPSSAVLPATDRTVLDGALIAVAREARDATGDVAFDPSFSPD